MHRVCALGESLAGWTGIACRAPRTAFNSPRKRDLGYRNSFSSRGTASLSEQGIRRIFCLPTANKHVLVRDSGRLPSFYPLGPCFCDSSTPWRKYLSKSRSFPVGKASRA
jgi:hypothetical protein